MKNWIKRLLFVTILVTLMSTCAYAKEDAAEGNPEENIVSSEVYVVNPLYEDVISVEDLKASLQEVEASEEELEAQEAGELETSEALTDHTDMAEALRKGLKRRDSFISYTVYEPDTSFAENGAVSDAWMKTHGKDIFQLAVEHTGVADEGDYLLWQYASYRLACSPVSVGGTAFEITVTFTIDYYTNATEEASVTAKVNNIISGLNTGDGSDYAKVKAIYDYLCANVRYDYDNLNNPSYAKQYTAYGALIDNKSVCQGYAVAFYRLALELGVDNRIITGTGYNTQTGANENHAWNIAKIGSYYYNLDATWDEWRGNVPPANYSYFLKCESGFPNHTRGAEYQSSGFLSAYPMELCNYEPCKGVHTAPASAILTPATPTTNGSIRKPCSVCGGDLETPVYISPASNVALSATEFVYNGGVQMPSVSVKDANGNDIASQYYTVNNAGGKDIGTYSCTVSFSGNYSGSVTKSFQIVPKGTSLKKPAAKSKSFVANWKKSTAANATGYEIRYSLKKSMASSKIKKVKGYKKTSVTVKSLKKKKKYYMQVRTYKVIGGNTYYSPWSGTKSVKVK